MFILNGSVYNIPSLSPDMDQAIMKIHEAFLGYSSYSVDSLSQTVEAFLNDPAIGFDQHDAYFNCFTILWQKWLQQGQFDNAENIWQIALNPANNWENINPGQRVHKGSPYYFWGMTAIIRGDLDKGYALMHQAFEEDKKTTGNPFPSGPASALVALNIKEKNQAFRQWVLLQGEYLELHLKEYRRIYNKNLSLAELQKIFLLKNRNTDAAFLFAYVLGRLVKISRIPSFALKNGFVSQLYLNLLFDLTLVVDDAIKAHNQNGNTFIHHAAFLSAQAGVGINQQQLGQEINQAFKKVFDIALNTILNDEFVLQDGQLVSGLMKDISITYGIRNRAAHDLTRILTVRDRFSEILQSIFNTLFLAIEILY